MALPNIYIVACGGTIAGRAASEEDLTGYTAGAATIDEVLQAVPAVHQYARIRGEQFCSIDSSDMSEELWLALAAAAVFCVFRALLCRRDAARAVRTGAGAVYHACVHNALHERDPELLAGLYKVAVFTLQAKYFRDTGWYVARHRALLDRLEGEDRAVLERALALRAGETPDLEADGGLLFRWAGALLRES